MIYLIYGAAHGARMHAVDAGRGVTVCNLIHATIWTCKETAHEIADLLRSDNPTWRFEVRAQR